MTLVVGAVWRGAGWIAWDSRAHLFFRDGSSSFDDAGLVSPAIGSFPGGWCAGGGSYAVARTALDTLQGSGGGSLDELAGLLAPSMSLACAGAPSLGYDAADSRVALLTVGSGALEAGSFQPRRGLQRYAPGSRFYIPPADVDRDALEVRWTSFVQDSVHASGQLARLRSLAAFYADAATMTDHVSGRLIVGLVQKPGADWQLVRLEGDAAELAEASDRELSAALILEIPCTAPSSSECSS